jgi:hypothetical protein
LQEKHKLHEKQKVSVCSSRRDARVNSLKQKAAQQDDSRLNRHKRKTCAVQ